jgi:hypothetical protein
MGRTQVTAIRQTTDDDRDSDIEYDADGAHITNDTMTSFSTNYKIRRKQSRKIATIHKRLSASARAHQLGTFNTTRGDIEKRKSFFRHWIRTLRDIFLYQPRFYFLLCDYPTINTTNYSTTSCLALAQFLYTHIDKSSRESIRQALSNEQDGIELLLHMHQHYGASNITDTYKAKEHLESTTWERTDTIDMFNSRFMRRLATFHTTLSTANNTKHIQKLTNDDLIQLYLTRLVTTMPHTNSLYTRIRDEFVQVQSHMDNGSPVHTSITKLTQQLQSLEALELNNITQRSHQEFRKPR